MMPFNNQLTDAQQERLSLLLEEAGEVQQIIGKIQRHGYASWNPELPPEERISNMELLEKEIGHLKFAIDWISSVDLNASLVERHRVAKRHSVCRWLHHSIPPVFGFGGLPKEKESQ